MNRYLIQQGYSSSQEEFSLIQARLMPVIYASITITGLALEQPLIHFALFALGFLGFISNKHHPIDVIYNKFAVSSKKLPAINPPQRRYANLMTASFNLAIGLLLTWNLAYAALATGAFLIVIHLLAVLFHFCLASWLYEQFYAFLGDSDTISLSEARELRMKGALLVDVRTPKEHEKQIITGALNIPLPKLADHDIYHGKEVIVFCNSGMRSKEAIKIINKTTQAKAYSLGSIENAIKL